MTERQKKMDETDKEVQNSIDYVQAEKGIIDELIKGELDKNAQMDTRIRVIMMTRDLARSFEDLTDYLKDFPGLNNVSELQSRIAALIYDQSIEVIEKRYGISICCLNQKNLGGIKEKYGKKMEEVLIRLREDFRNSNCVKDEGLLSGGGKKSRKGAKGYREEGDVYVKLIQYIEEAQHQIWLPMLSTTPQEKTIEALRKNKNAEIKILLASKKVLKRMWRNPENASAKEWARRFKDCKNVQIREYNEVADNIISSSAIFDKKYTRLCVFNPKEATMKGRLLSFGGEGAQLNVTTLACSKFEEIWNRAKPVNIRWWLRPLRWVRKNKWRILEGFVFAVLSVLSFYFAELFSEENKVWKILLQTAGTTIFGILFTTVLDKIRRYILTRTNK